MSDEPGHADERFSVVVLAGERPGGSEFSRQLGLPASVLVEVAGKPSLTRVIETLEHSGETRGGVLCGPEESVFLGHPEFKRLLSGSAFEWMPPRSGPSDSALAAIDRLDRYPVLVTTGDHALLTPALVDEFCGRARALDVDLVLGLVPYERVRSAYPATQRTVLRFRDGGYCGSNLFAVLNQCGREGPRFWRELEADRKRPWRIARRVGLAALLQYLLRRLDLDRALDYLSGRVGCRLGCVLLESPRAAVDVDSVADRDLAERILRTETGA